MAVLEDLTFIRKSLVDSWEEHAKNVPELLDKERLVSFESEEFYIKSLKNNSGSILIAEMDDKSVGLIVAYINKLGYFFTHRQTLYIDDIYIVKNYRNMGIAQALIGAIEEYAKNNGVKRLDGRIYTYNEPMQRLLRKLGYISPFSTWVKIIS